MGVAAVNGGINLLFLIFGMMLSLILVSGILSELCLRELQVTRRPPGTLHAGAPFLMGISVRNLKRRIPTFSLEVEDLLGERPVDRRCYFLKIPAGRVQETAYKHTLSRRGVYQFAGFRISTRFPFGFIRKSRDIEAPLEVVVYPAVFPVPDPFVGARLIEAGRQHAPARSRAGEFHGLREFRAGDDPGDIHWRTSARRGRPFVRESEEESGRTVLLVLENGVITRGPSSETAAQFERAVSLAASLVVTLLRSGFHVGLATAEAFVAPAGGAIQANRILRRLALVEPRAGAPIGDLPGAARGVAALYVTPGVAVPRMESPASDAQAAS